MCSGNVSNLWNIPAYQLRREEMHETLNDLLEKQRKKIDQLVGENMRLKERLWIAEVCPECMERCNTHFANDVGRFAVTRQCYRCNKSHVVQEPIEAGEDDWEKEQ